MKNVGSGLYSLRKTFSQILCQLFTRLMRKRLCGKLEGSCDAVQQPSELSVSDELTASGEYEQECDVILYLPDPIADNGPDAVTAPPMPFVGSSQSAAETTPTEKFQRALCSRLVQPLHRRVGRAASFCATRDASEPSPTTASHSATRDASTILLHNLYALPYQPCQKLHLFRIQQ